MILVDSAGLILGILALIGIAVTVLRPASRSQIKSGSAVMFSLILCTWVFHAIVPAGVEDRKMLIAVPALILFTFAGGFWLADWLPTGYGFRAWSRPIVALTAACVFSFTAFAIPRQTRYGYSDAARFITAQPDLRRATILVSDNWIGEGLLISEIAMKEPRPSKTIVRGTKALAQVDWAGFNYRCLYSSSDDIKQAIDRIHASLVVSDTFAGPRDLPHNQLLRQALQDTGRFELIRTFDGQSPSGAAGRILIYRVKPPA